MAKTDLRDYSKMESEEVTDPLELLKSIASLLNVKGGVAGQDEMSKITGLMRNSKKLVGRCIYLSVLRVTRNEDVMRRFISEGGWKILNKWLSDAKETDNIPIIQDILKLLNRLPVTIQHLRENNTPKIVKHFAKSSNSKLKSAATVLMSSWMAIITGSSAPPTGDSEPPKKKKKEKEKKKPKSEPQVKPKSENKAAPPPVMKAPSFAKFRKTGLETEQSLPKKKVKSKTEQIVGKRNSTDADISVPEKKLKPAVELKPKKIIMASEGFMDALNSASNPLPVQNKKIKRRPLKPTTLTSNSNSSNSNKSPQDTEVAMGDANDFSATELLRKISPKRTESPTPTEPTEPKLNKYGKPMKSVRFKSEEFLESVRYFEVDENERVNVSTQSFKDAQHREMMIERQLLKGGKMSLGHEDTGEGAWHRPSPIDDLEILVVPGCQSVEKDIQTEREKTVLMSIFLSKEMVPETPTEPDPEPYEIAQPKVIPFDDESAVVESMEPEPEQGSTTANDVIMKNMLSGIQQQEGSDLTEKLKQILQTASAITNTSGSNGQNPPAQPQVMQDQPGQDMQSAMMWSGEVSPQGNPQMGGMDMNGQQMQPQMGFFGSQMMVPMQDPNFYGQNWNAPTPQHHGGPPQGMNGPRQQMYNQNWRGGGPQWRAGPRHPRGGPPRRGMRGDFRGNWRGRWHNDRRR